MSKSERWNLSYDANRRRKLKSLVKTDIHQSIENSLKLAWETINPEGLSLRIVLKGSCFFKRKQMVVQIGLDDVLSHYQRHLKNKMTASTPELHGVIIMLHEIGHGLDGEGEDSIKRKLSARREMALKLKSEEFEAAIPYLNEYEKYVLLSERTAWAIGKTLYSVPEEDFMRVRFNCMRTYEGHCKSLRRGLEKRMLQKAS